MQTTPLQRGHKPRELFQMPERHVYGRRPVPNSASHTAMIRGARNYAQGQASDPFAFNRAMSHIKSGIAGLIVDEKSGRATDGFYDAKLGIEGRSFTNSRGEVENYNVEIVVDIKA
jgi:hypothetical protein